LPGFLGTQKQFNERFGKPILLSRYAKSSSKEQEAGIICKHTCIEMLSRYIIVFKTSLHGFLRYFTILVFCRCTSNGNTTQASVAFCAAQAEGRCTR